MLKFAQTGLHVEGNITQAEQCNMKPQLSWVLFTYYRIIYMLLK